MKHALIAPGARVAVIGAGASGLAAARALREANFAPTVFEQGDEVGGQWNYGSTTSVIYRGLRCNLPKECMQFSDIPFDTPPDSTSYLTHQDVQKYLLDYTERFSLRPHIRFRNTVNHIVPNDSEYRWSISVSDNNDDKKTYHEFDAVCIANGHYSVAKPYLPPGTVAFCKGGDRTVKHSRVYRVPSPYVGRRVVVLGASSSGSDIALELERAGASAVFLSHKHGSGRSPFNGTIPQAASISYLSANGTVHFLDGSSVKDIDDVLLCTGFSYDLSFLDQKSGVFVEPGGRVINGLVAHCIGRKRPTLGIIGVPFQVAAFPLFEEQAYFYASVLKGTITRETLWELDMAEKEDAQVRGEERKYFHRLGDRQWDFRRVQATLANLPMPKASLIEIYQDSAAARHRQIGTYRERKYKLLGDGPREWRVYEDGVDVTEKFELWDEDESLTP